jgi:hypothetical protein
MNFLKFHFDKFLHYLIVLKRFYSCIFYFIFVYTLVFTLIYQVIKFYSFFQHLHSKIDAKTCFVRKICYNIRFFLIQVI